MLLLGLRGTLAKEKQPWSEERAEVEREEARVVDALLLDLDLNLDL